MWVKDLISTHIWKQVEIKINKIIKTRFLMQCLYADAYYSGNYHRSAEGCGNATKEMSIYPSIRLNDPVRDKVVLKHTPCHLSGVHLVTPLWWSRNYEMHEHTIPLIC
jgi:hypothetical protein